MQRQTDTGRYRGLFALFLLLMSVTGIRANASNPAAYGADLEIGGAGTGHGTFAAVTAMAFDTNNNLYVLDSTWTQPGATRSNFLIQRFTDSGQFVSQYSIYDSRLGTNNAPDHIALDSQGNLYLTQPRAGLVQEYNSSGTRIRDFTLASASAVATRIVGTQEQILVLPRLTSQSVQQVNVYFADGRTGTPIHLSTAITNCLDLTTDKNGNLYALANTSQVYKFDPNGNLITVIGSGISGATDTDGSVLGNGARVDSRGNLYSLSPGNPGSLARYSADLTTVTTRPGLFSWCDAWTYSNVYANSYAPIAIDRKDRLWVGVNGTFSDGQVASGNPMHFRPCVFRAATNFLDTAQMGVQQQPMLGLGLKASFHSNSGRNEFRTLDPQLFAVNIAAATRRLSRVTVSYAIFDVYKKLLWQGSQDIALQDGVKAAKNLAFQPSKWGWYEFEYMLSSNGTILKTGTAHLGFSPSNANLPEVSDAEIKGGPVDAARQADVGLQLIRTSTQYGLDTVDQQVSDAARYGLTMLVQFTSPAECTSAAVQQAVSRFRGRVRYWEVINEPNGSMSPQAYVTLLQQTYNQIKSIDPQAMVVAPAICGIDLNWIQQFYQLGGKNYFDILSIHDYEGNGSIDPYHWTYKINALKQIMASFNDGNKPIWQTERAIGGVQGGNFMGGVQAVRMLLHRDLLASLGIPADTNYHFYANEHGYSPVPTYLWSSAGPHPIAMALRTRTALLKGHIYGGMLNFGATGNKLFFGVKYTAAVNTVLSVHNLGLPDQTTDFKVAGTANVTMLDAFGNCTTLPVTNGVVHVTVPSLPVYLVQLPGQTITPVPVDFGHNMASEGQFSYSGTSNGAFSTLTNGIMESIHTGNPNQNFWVGDMPSDPTAAPMLTVTFPTSRSISKAILYGINADNQYCALLDYDVQAYGPSGWVTLASSHTPCPPSDSVISPDSYADTWYMDQNIGGVSFPAVNTSKIRFVARRVTAGFAPDAVAAAAILTAWGGTITPKFMLREVEIYP